MICPSPTHVSLNDYQRRGCRCPAAVRAAKVARHRWYERNATRMGRRRMRIVDGTGTRRRLQSLSAAGWGLSELAPRLNLSEQRLLQLRAQDRVERSTADMVARVYDGLAGLPGRNGRAKGVARRHGWPLPVWWADDIDDPAASPQSPWLRHLAARLPLLPDRDALDDAADREFDAALDAIEAADEAWFAARREVAA